MNLYNVHLYRTVRLLFKAIEADTPKAAAAIARIGLTGNADEIDDGYADDVFAQIDVAGDNPPKCTVTIDFEPERLRKAAAQMQETLEYVALMLADFKPDFLRQIGLNVALEKVEAVLHVVACRQSNMTRKLPPDPEHMNDDRAAWAASALTAFMRCTGTDLEDALGDLLANLMHWCDRNNYDFDAALDRARAHYNAETTGE
jgi:hypothetical protein